MSIPIRMGDGTIGESVWLAEDTFRLSLSGTGLGQGISPGQFFMVKAWEGNDPLLRRPISVSDVAGEAIYFVIRVTGKGTRLIAGRRPGDRLSLVGPLGRGFLIPPGYDRHILVAGGVGIAPFPLLARAIRNTGQTVDIKLLYGERDSSRLIDTGTMGFGEIETSVITEDGSSGRKGLVTDLLSRVLTGEGEPAAIYASGPWPMLKAVQAQVEGHRGPLQVSMESFMGCGLGSCMGCVIAVKGEGERSYERVCHSGPVFDGRDVIF